MHPALLQQAEIHPASLADTKVTCSLNTDYAPKSTVHPPFSGNTIYLSPSCLCCPVPPDSTICMRRSRLACLLLPRQDSPPAVRGYLSAWGCLVRGTRVGVVPPQLRNSSPRLARGASVRFACLNQHGLRWHPAFCSPPGTLPRQKATQTSYCRLRNSTMLALALLCHYRATHPRLPCAPHTCLFPQLWTLLAASCQISSFEHPEGISHIQESV